MQTELCGCRPKKTLNNSNNNSNNNNNNKNTSSRSPGPTDTHRHTHTCILTKIIKWKRVNLSFFQEKADLFCFLCWVRQAPPPFREKDACTINKCERLEK